MRRCGSCQLCCELLAVYELDKPVNTRCPNQTARGCSIYKNHPESCKVFTCAWRESLVPNSFKPNKVHAVIWEAYLDNLDTGEPYSIIKVSFDPKKLRNLKVMDWVNRVSYVKPVLTEHGTRAILIQDGKPQISIKLGDSFSFDADSEGKMVNIRKLTND